MPETGDVVMEPATGPEPVYAIRVEGNDIQIARPGS